MILNISLVHQVVYNEFGERYVCKGMLLVGLLI